MSDEGQIFEGEKPHEILLRWMDEAQGTEPGEANAMSLATVDENGLPDVRIVLMKDADETGLTFFTNYESRKGQQLLSAKKAAVNFHWKALKRQVRVRGVISKASAAVSDAYYRSRPLGSRLGAWASDQSRPLESREALIARVEKAKADHGDDPARPPHWGGFLLQPTEFEFWADAEYRLHNRFRWVREKQGETWAISRLNP